MGREDDLPGPLLFEGQFPTPAVLLYQLPCCMNSGDTGFS
jgi:hypothetical protein